MEEKKTFVCRAVIHAAGSVRPRTKKGRKAMTDAIIEFIHDFFRFIYYRRTESLIISIFVIVCCIIGLFLYCEYDNIKKGKYRK